jgi:hypothetical protein
MKRHLSLVAAIAVALGAVLIAAPPQRALRAQPILGVDTNPPTPEDAASPFFDDGTLHEIRLTINSRDWQALKDNYLSNTYYPADFRWRDQTLRNIGIRSRGTGSRSNTKPGLRVDFDRYDSAKKFLGLKSFVLRNNVQDASGLHERLSMLMFRRIGAAAPREAHTRLYVNNEYAGLFTIVENIDKNYVARTVGEDSGYLFEYDYPVGAEPYYFEDRGDDPGAYVPLPFKPQTHESDPRPEFVQQMVAAVNRSSDAVFRSQAGEYIDFAQFLRHVAVEVFVGDYDGFLGNVGMNNFYMYRLDNQNRFVFIPWDKSESFLAGPATSIWHNITDVPDAQKNRLMSRVLSYSDLYNVYLDTLMACASAAAEPAEDDARGWLEREVAHEADQIRAATMADTLKPFTNADFEEEVADLLEFARARSQVVTAEVAAARR